MTEGNAINAESPAGECYRCGYDLRTIADDQPCPECGLLAGRSRRPTDELQHSRPRWLRSIAIGSILIFLGIAWALILTCALSVLDLFPSVAAWARVWLLLIFYPSYVAATLLLFCGVMLLTQREGRRRPNDANHWRCLCLRLFAATPFLAILPSSMFRSMHIGNLIGNYPWRSFVFRAALAFRAVGFPPLAVLLMFHLRFIARRARNARLARQCAIVGIGAALTLAAFFLVVLMFSAANNAMWIPYHGVAGGLFAAAGIAGLIFTLWTMQLLIRFAVIYNRADHQVRRKWSRDDRSTPAI